MEYSERTNLGQFRLAEVIFIHMLNLGRIPNVVFDCVWVVNSRGTSLARDYANPRFGGESYLCMSFRLQ
jgi:hypothetical protein